jgi:hypothetical protein
MDWSYFDKFDGICDKYLPVRGEGDTVATQIVTAVCKLVYKWYNDGDVYDNTYSLDGWANDLSSYANWLYMNTDASYILEKISECFNGEQYESVLAELADSLLDEDFLNKCNQKKIGSIYDCTGPFKFVEGCEDEEDYWEEDCCEDEEEVFDEED